MNLGIIEGVAPALCRRAHCVKRPNTAGGYKIRGLNFVDAQEQ
jgi:hypothetical protein